MLVPISWLREYVDEVPPISELVERITLAGMEVDAVHEVGTWWDPEKLVVGQVVAIYDHPNADRLVIADVDYGGPAPERVVTGAPNLFVYKGVDKLPILKVAFAHIGAVLVDAYSDVRPRPMKKLKPSKIRGVISNGMVCSERELGLSEEHEGILLLPEDAPVGMPLRDYLGDTVLEVSLTPDMARCLSMIGMAREVAALTGVALRLPPDEVCARGDDTAGDYVDVVIANSELCNRYVGLIITDVQIGESPRWMQDRLRKAGMRPINNVVDITNYVMLEWGQPLHAFDYDVLVRRAAATGRGRPQIIVRTARAGEKIITLDGVERELDESMLLITDTAGPIAIAGVMGGAETEVNQETRNILLESATFESINNRRTAQKLKIPSEASYRFTRGVPATLNAIAARRAAELMRRYAGGRIVPGMVDDYPIPQAQRIVYTTASEVSRQLGMEISLDAIAAALQRLDFAVALCSTLPEGEVPADALFGLCRRPGEPLLRCTAPWHRLDIQIPADLTEEVARIIGYEHIATTLLADTLPPQRRNHMLETEEKIRDILVGCGLQETINYALTSPENHDKLNPGRPSAAELGIPFVTLANPLSTRRRVMRRSLLVSALENLAYNSRFTGRLAIFEIGRVYLPEKGDGTRPYEDRRLSVLLTGPRRPASVHPDPAGAEEFDFFDLKGIIETLLARLGFTHAEVEFISQPNSATFGPRCAQLKIRGEPQGILGELNPRVLAAFDLPSTRVCAAELHIEPLIKPGWTLEVMPAISNYPPVVEDLAFVVAEQVTAHQVLEAIRQGGGTLLANVELFDIYRGSPIPAGYKSLAYKVTYQSLEKNLTDAEVASIRNRIIRQVADAVGGILRTS
jgi:phenylalanyl-tRNA synthetase beta chain